MTSVTNSYAISILRLRTAIRAIKLEESGMTRRGKSAAQMYREYYGLPRSTKREDIIARIEKDIEDAGTRMLTESNDGGDQ